MILLIDNYDSFTYNLYHQLSEFEEDIQVVRNDAVTVEVIRLLNPQAIVISPGPGTPTEAGICIQVIRQLYKEFPILGVCLGHQAIGEAFGANVTKAKHILHGKTSLLEYTKTGLFEQMNEEVEVMRYHSLVIEKGTLNSNFHVDAYAKEDGEIMAIHHKEYPVFGLQFHPESIGTEQGRHMIEAFIDQAKVK